MAHEQLVISVEAGVLVRVRRVLDREGLTMEVALALLVEEIDRSGQVPDGVRRPSQETQSAMREALELDRGARDDA